MNKKIFFTIIVISNLLFQFKSSLVEKNFGLTEGERTVEFNDLKIGDIVELKLEGNPTTGYTWYIDDGNFKILSPQNLHELGDNGVMSGQYISDKTKDENGNRLVGSGGVYSFKFKIDSKGQDKVDIKYARIWEKNQPYSTIKASFSCNKEK